MITLANKVTLVTGGSKGIGAAICKLLAQAGSSISLTYNADKLSALKTASEIRDLGVSCFVTKADTSRSKDVNRTIEATLEKFSRIDILVNNAGVWKSGRIGKMTEQQWDETINVNLKGTFLYCNAVASQMKKQRWGRIINVASTAGQRGEPVYSHYAASKAGMIAFTKSIAVELAPYNITANCVSPGWVETAMTSRVLHNKSRRREIEKIIPRGKVASPEDIAGAVLYLASDLASHVIGATINVNGGAVLI